MRTGLRASEARDHLIASGTLFASTAHLAGLLGVADRQLPSALRRAVARGDFARVCRGGWVAIDDHTKAAGRPLPDLRAYIDAMMGHLGHDYYIGFNAAAAAHGAAHRRYTNTVVATTSRTTHRSVNGGRPAPGSMTLTCLSRRDPLARSTVRRRMPEAFFAPGTFVTYSTAEVTLLDMVQRPDLAGGLDHVATVAADLVYLETLAAERLAAAAAAYPQTVRQRCGHILDAVTAEIGFGAGFDTGPLHAAVAHPAAITPLMPGVGRFFPAVYDETAPLRVDGRWQVRINTLLDPDL